MTTRIWANLLVDGFCVLSLALGSLVFLAMQTLSGARWSNGLRRPAESIAAALPAAALMMLLLFFGRTSLYRWSVAGTAYLNTTSVFVRMLAFLGPWLLFARAIVRPSTSTRVAAAFVVFFGISFSLATTDWLLSIDPRWSSTIFAVYEMAGMLTQATAAIALLAVMLHEQGRLGNIVSDDQLHELGKLLFAFTTFWAYLWFSQYLLIWYSDLPDETTYYVVRTGAQWRWWFWLDLGLNWIVPFVVLLAREPKRRPAVLKWIAVVILVGRWVDVYLTVMPQAVPAAPFGVVEIALAAGYAGVTAAVVGSAVRKATRHRQVQSAA